MNDKNPLNVPIAATCEYKEIARKRNPWRPSFFRRAPWLGLIAILGALMGVLVAVIILYISNNKSIYSWAVQPSVYLAITAAATNILLRFALGEAAVIAWWRHALQKDSTIADLHQQWRNGQSLWAALTSRRHFSAIAVASILVALVPINGPLLQRALHIRQAHVEQTTDVHLSIASQIPEGYACSKFPCRSSVHLVWPYERYCTNWPERRYTGYLSSRAHVPTLLTSYFVQIVQQYTQRMPISIPNSGCTGSCNTNITGAGLVANCSKSDFPFSLSSGASNISKLIEGTVIFGTNLLWPSYAEIDLLSWPVMTPGTFNLGVQYKNVENCDGTLMIRNCTFRPAHVTYPVSIDGSSSSISLAADTTIFDDGLINILAVPPMDGLGTNSSFNISTYGGLFKSLDDLYHSSLSMNYGAIGYQIFNEGALSNHYLNTSKDLKELDCSVSFRDPTDDIIAAIRELMFRAAIASANDTQAADVQHVTAQ